jgi:hypothetical protein
MTSTNKRGRRTGPRARKLSPKKATLRSAVVRAPLFVPPPPMEELRRPPPMYLWRARPHDDDDHD